MSKIDRLLDKFYQVPKDFTWDELVKVLGYFGYFELSRKGKMGGSRRKFVNQAKAVISLHKPHPGNIVKQYVIRKILENLGDTP